MGGKLEINCDLHIHGLYSSATSSDMIPKNIVRGAKLKGLNLVGSGDILHEGWEKYIKELNKFDEGIYESEGIYFLLQAEVEDKDRVHHLIFFPSFSKVEEMRETISKYGSLKDGRPKINLDGEEIAEICKSSDCAMGFAHAFTPYFGLYSKFNSFKECYKSFSNEIFFMELGLSADSKMADKISELHNLSFLSCSDCHSPWPHRLGREMTKIEVSDITYDSIINSIKNKKCKLNVKLDPREGKYHRTRCRNCLIFFDNKDAASYRWKCPACGGTIKKGVRERIEELKDCEGNPERPKCLHIIPLAEIISIIIEKDVFSTEVQMIYRKLIEKYGNELKILIEISPVGENEIEKKVFNFIQLFREEKINYLPGGAGEYGKIVPPWKNEKMKVWVNGKIKEIELNKMNEIDNIRIQTSLADY
ncbi:MAG: endonuclease Q family protein [Candidatus Micrarchaeia archaeon]